MTIAATTLDILFLIVAAFGYMAGIGIGIGVVVGIMVWGKIPKDGEVDEL